MKKATFRVPDKGGCRMVFDIPNVIYKGMPVRDALERALKVNAEQATDELNRNLLDDPIVKVLVSPCQYECAFITADSAWVIRTRICVVAKPTGYLGCELLPSHVSVYILHRWMQWQGHEWTEVDISDTHDWSLRIL